MTGSEINHAHQPLKHIIGGNIKSIDNGLSLRKKLAVNVNTGFIIPKD